MHVKNDRFIIHNRIKCLYVLECMYLLKYVKYFAGFHCCYFIHMLINKILQKKDSKKLLIHTNNVDSSINIVFFTKISKKRVWEKFFNCLSTMTFAFSNISKKVINLISIIRFKIRFQKIWIFSWINKNKCSYSTFNGSIACEKKFSWGKPRTIQSDIFSTYT